MVTSIHWFHGMVATIELCVLLATSTASAQVQAPDRAKPVPDNLRQQPQNRQPQSQDRQPVTANRLAVPERQAQNTDFLLASCLAISNGEEVELGRMATEHSKSEKVREFADKMVKDHSEMLSRLEKFGAKPGFGQTARSDGGAERQAQLQPVAAGQTQQPALPAQGRFDFLSMKQKIARQCLKSAEKCWADKQAEEAEMGYVGSQIVLHQQMIDAATVMRDYASPELQSLIDEGIETAESHKKHAEQLIEELGQEAHSKSDQK